MDDTKLHAFIGRLLADLGGANSVPMVRLGDRLGLYKALHRAGPMTAGELAAATGCAPRYIAEWLAHQAASGYLDYDPLDERFTLPDEQAMVFADEDSPVYAIGAFDLAAELGRDIDKIATAFKTGEGVGYGERNVCLFCAMARFFRTGYQSELVQHWLPALTGVDAKLKHGGKVADVGCGHGLSTIMMALAYPSSTFVGYDFHAGSVEAARRHAAEHGLSDRVRFEVSDAAGYAEGDFDLIAFFDALHDLGDPVGAARHAAQRLAPGGTLMLIEPAAGDSLAENLNPIGRLYYAGSTMICVPVSLAQAGGAALGAQAGEAKLTAVLKEGGFGTVRRAAETPFNIVLEAHI